MKPAFWARRAHKWIGLAIGIQALLWMASGLYMVSISIHVIHGDHLAKSAARPLSGAPMREASALAAQFPGMTGFRVKRLVDRVVIEVRHDGRTSLVDAVTGEALSPLGEAAARDVAVALYQGKAPIRSAALIDKAPQEVATRPVPLWRIAFDDANETTLYLSPDTGEMLAKRHDLWRWFDFLWMFHIMDYDARTDVNNTLLRVASSIGFVFALSGAWLLFYSFRRRPAA
ncbi:PepSY domain-containing protein [Tahibacter soli]|uniref:PepSY domain-containing protein n=1 Tax=Tahibacter soli TaxID=2983605 RepID=A0A9X3YI06_9GAMM|nr:PepSY domain-containing protein [Tahibacter soli]MDC8011178.1 PepSY domain-containing protein [Tahibacter soli]